MKINEIQLYNFGSYEGEIVFNTKVTDEKTIVLIGGKNIGTVSITQIKFVLNVFILGAPINSATNRL